MIEDAGKLLIGCYWWKPDKDSKFEAAYTFEDVLRLARQVRQHCTVPHDFVCVTGRLESSLIIAHDGATVRPVGLDRTTHVPGTCFARLMTFHPRGREIFGGDRFLQIDLDTLIVGNIDHLCRRTENVIMWRNPARVPWEPMERIHPDAPDGAKGLIHTDEHGKRRWLVNQARCYFNTSVVMHKLGSMPWIWSLFKTDKPQAKDDQWYLSDILGPGVPYFDGDRDGVYRLAREDTPGSGVDGELPPNACIVTFPGSEGKWTKPEIRAANPWIEGALA